LLGKNYATPVVPQPSDRFFDKLGVSHKDDDVVPHLPPPTGVTERLPG